MIEFHYTYPWFLEYLDKYYLLNIPVSLNSFTNILVSLNLFINILEFLYESLNFLIHILVSLNSFVNIIVPCFVVGQVSYCTLLLLPFLVSVKDVERSCYNCDGKSFSRNISRIWWQSVCSSYFQLSLTFCISFCRYCRFYPFCRK